MKTPLILLHGAIGASCQLKAIAGSLSDRFDIHLFDFPGHGGKEPSGESFSIPVFAEALKQYILQHGLLQPAVFGFSMGGYVAMYLARQFPELLSGVATLGTKYQWDEATAEREVKMLNPEVIQEKVPVFAAGLAAIHAPNDWKEVLRKTARMLINMGKTTPLTMDDFRTIKIPALLMVGDRDKMVTLEETAATYKHMPNARMAVLPNTPHPIEQVDPALLPQLLFHA